MEVYVCSAILESYEAAEIARDLGVTEEEVAKQWFSEIVNEAAGSFRKSSYPYSRFVCNIDDEWELYYNYAADHYFAMIEDVNKHNE